MIVGQGAAVDAGVRKAGDIPWVHAVIDAFTVPVIVTIGDAGFKINDAQVG